MAMRESNQRKASEMLQDANEILALAAELSPAHPEITGLQAELLHMSGRSQEAKEVIEKCASHYIQHGIGASQDMSTSKLASLHITFARAFMSIEDPRGALKQLALSIELAPHVPDAYQTAAAAYKMLGQNSEARNALSKANKIISSLPP